MAELTVSYFLEKLANLFIEEAVVLNGVRDDLEWLEGEMKQIQKLVKDAEARKGNRRVRNWLGSVTDFTHDIENFVDDFISKVALLNISLQNRKKLMYPAIFLKWMARFKFAKAHHKFGEEIRRIKIAIHRISKKPSINYGIEDVDGVEATFESLRWRRWFSISNKDQDVVGVQEDVWTLVARLCEPDPQRSVISVVGMGGSGKTTIAKQIYNHPHVRFQFDLRAWVYVSENFTLRELLGDIARQIPGFGVEILEKMSRKDLEVKISKFLMEKRYLIVLDDVWEKEVWDEVKQALPCGMNGSSILITTRNKDVASYFDSNCRPHELRLLNSEESRELLYKKVFKTEYTRTSSELAKLEESVTYIVKICDGVPLALMEIGNVLLRKNISPPALWKVEDTDEYQLCLRILALSYHHLPTHLKWCFLYFGIFPNDYEIPARKLLRLWVAEGFIHPIDGRTQEEVADEYLEQLNHKTLIQPLSWRPDGKIQTFRVLRLLRELAVSEAQRVDFLNPHPSLAARRIGFHSKMRHYISSISYPMVRMPHLRTLLHFCKSRYYWKLEDFDGGIKLIRVLDFEGVPLLRVPDGIRKLIHLRYLGLKQTGLKGVPSFIGNLYNLQTLNIGRNSIKELPLTICNLRSLQTLDIRHNLITHIPSEISVMEKLRHLYMDREVLSGELQIDQLRNIQTISVVHAGNWIESAFGKLRNLRKLGIYGGFAVDFNVDIWEFISDLDLLGSLELVVSKWIPVPTQLPFLHLLGLHKLHLSGQLTRPLNVQDFPPNLTQLSLSWSYLEQDPIATLEKLPKLRILLLQMQAYVGKQMVFSTNGFPQLEFLELKSLNELRECKVEQGAMLVITRLSISRCVQLNSLPEGLQYLTTLQKLELLWMLPTFQARLEPYKGDDWYKIQNLPSVVISGTSITRSEN